MIPLTVTPDLDNHPWRDLGPHAPVIGGIDRIGRLSNGTDEGNSVVVVAIVMPDGKRYLAETTLRLMRIAMVAIEAAETRQNGGAS